MNNNISVYWAQEVLVILYKFSLSPTGIALSAENGIGIYFMKDKFYADIECLNTGEILAVTSDSQAEPRVWEIYGGEIPEAVEQIRDFISK